MYCTTKTSLFTLLLMFPFSAQAEQPRHADEIYYLSNCFNSNPQMQSSYAEIDYYANKSLSAIAGHPNQPDLRIVINPSSSIDYEDGSWGSVSGAPFNFIVVIGQNAGTANAGTVVGSAISSTFDGTMECVRLARVVVHMQKEVTCYADYACTDSSN